MSGSHGLALFPREEAILSFVDRAPRTRIRVFMRARVMNPAERDFVAETFHLSAETYYSQPRALLPCSAFVETQLTSFIHSVAGIVLTVKLQAERQLEKEIHLREDLKQKMMTQRDYCNALEQDNRYLRQLLMENNIDAPPPVDAPELEISQNP